MKKAKLLTIILSTFLIMSNVYADGEILDGVPDTFSMQSAILLAIAMFDIVLGLGIFIYVKKNKIKK